MVDLPLIITQAGPQPTPPATIRSNIDAMVSETNPGYTSTLPGSLIEDVLSTETGGVVTIDQARVDLVDSVSPYGANAFLLNQIGQQTGIALGLASNTGVNVVFTGSVGLVIQNGFVVSDGTQQYIVQGGTVIGASGQSQPVLAVAINPGTWAVPANTVTTLVTSVPSGYSVTVANPLAGTPGAAAESWTSYRTRVIEAQRAPAIGTPSLLRTYLNAVPGVQARLISIRQASPPSGGWEVIVGGSGDQYAIAFAIYSSGLDVSTLIGSSMTVSGITKALAPPSAASLTANTSGGFLSSGTVYVKLTYVAANGETEVSSEANTAVTGPTGQVVVTSPGASPGATGYNVYASNATGTEKLQNSSPILIGTNYAIDTIAAGAAAPTINTTGIVTTSLNHGYVTGNSVTISGVNPSGYNGTFTVTVFSETTFSTRVDTSGYAAWVSGGVCAPNARNVTVAIADYPDVYNVPFVLPPQQTVTMTATWNTTASNFLLGNAVAQLAAPALVAYVNALAVGQPMNLDDMAAAFTAAVASVIPSWLVTRLVFAIDINGVATVPVSGSVIVEGDAESFFFAAANAVTVTQG